METKDPDGFRIDGVFYTSGERGDFKLEVLDSCGVAVGWHRSQRLAICF